MSAELIVPATLVLAGIAVALASAYLTRRDFRKRFATRPVLRPEEVLSEFSPGDAETLAPLWMKLESVLGVPVGKLRLTDRFAAELRAHPKFAIYHPETDVLDELRECFPDALSLTEIYPLLLTISDPPPLAIAKRVSTASAGALLGKEEPLPGGSLPVSKTRVTFGERRRGRASSSRNVA